MASWVYLYLRNLTKRPRWVQPWVWRIMPMRVRPSDAVGRAFHLRIRPRGCHSSGGSSRLREERCALRWPRGWHQHDLLSEVEMLCAQRRGSCMRSVCSGNAHGAPNTWHGSLHGIRSSGLPAQLVFEELEAALLCGRRDIKATEEALQEEGSAAAQVRRAGGPTAASALQLGPVL